MGAGKTQSKSKDSRRGPSKFHKKHFVKDTDQIQEDLKNPDKLLNQPKDQDLPGLGQFYCLHCARYFVTKHHLDKHQQSKAHKQRVKINKLPPYSQREAEMGAGIAPPDNGSKIRTAQAANEVMDDFGRL
eukprot:TRINITY_DN14832_c0_g1_i1.p1 TRINITY_DN14832_c0_g1~~TRINITY_DN14832_c0_g1_i1.p1  ORF type:complete len:130 (+),score=21.97 TRINITY_DN14832_c0_g1_i1:69-458(+)